LKVRLIQIVSVDAPQWKDMTQEELLAHVKKYDNADAQTESIEIISEAVCENPHD
jgi:phosphopantothenate synthetase